MNALKSLNAQLVAWGYSEQPRAVVYRRMRDEASEALRAGEDPMDWMEAKEYWVQHGDALLEDIQACMWSEIKDFCDGDVDLLANFWDKLSRVGYRVQYMMAAAEHYIDSIYFK